MFTPKPLWQLIEQWDAQRRAKPVHRNPHAKTARNAEMVWMRNAGVPVSHIARMNGITDIRVRAILKREQDRDELPEM